MNSRDLILELNRIDAIQFGEFELKCGSLSPLYLDLRVTVSYPHLLKSIADRMAAKLEDVPYDVLCGVPYTALPFATSICLKTGKPMVMKRKEVKPYGLRKVIEGHFQPGDRCLVVEDLVSSGASVLETVRPLEDAGLKVTDVVVLVDREQGAEKRLSEMGYQLHSLLRITEVVDTLSHYGKISMDQANAVKTYIVNNQLVELART